MTYLIYITPELNKNKKQKTHCSPSKQPSRTPDRPWAEDQSLRSRKAKSPMPTPRITSAAWASFGAGFFGDGAIFFWYGKHIGDC